MLRIIVSVTWRGLGRRQGCLEKVLSSNDERGILVDSTRSGAPAT